MDRWNEMGWFGVFSKLLRVKHFGVGIVWRLFAPHTQQMGYIVYHFSCGISYHSLRAKHVTRTSGKIPYTRGN